MHLLYSYNYGEVFLDAMKIIIFFFFNEKKKFKLQIYFYCGFSGINSLEKLPTDQLPAD